MKTQKKMRISSVIIIILLVLLTISTVRAVSELRSYNRRHYDTTDLTYLIRECDYPGMTYDYYNSLESISGEEKDHQNHWAVMHYFNDAVMYKAFQEHGDTERAARYADRMKGDQSAMGQYAGEADVINKMLKIGE